MLKKWKYGLYIILFSLTITMTSIVGVLAVFNADIFNNIGITYTPPKEVTLMPGYQFSENLLSLAGAEEDFFPRFVEETGPICTLIVFDYYTDENRAIVENADQCISVAEDGSDDILMYQVGETVYILSDYNILANEDCSYMFSSMYDLQTIEFNNFSTKKNNRNELYVFWM